jgi:Nucleotidyl transferase AbiEii toxin, Type IV TA system
MTKRPVANVAASVHQRLLTLAKSQGLPFNDVLQRYALERWLYRLSRSSEAGRFVLKGALMLAAWKVSALRPTRDIDLLGRMDNDLDRVREALTRVCATTVEDDGVLFDATMQMNNIAEDADYQGVRATFVGHLGNADLPMQIDIGFSDVITPGPVELSYPTLLDFPAARLQSYPRETSIAEKFEAMVKLGEINSRMKDFFDVWTLSESGAFDGSVLMEAVRATFAQRQTEIATDPICFSPSFMDDPAKQRQWNAFLKRSHLTTAPDQFGDVARRVQRFLHPIAHTLKVGKSASLRWPARGPWGQ